ncbi:hypothetical protein VP01_1152g3 [Puccinia sorghi]|uniref:Uncharacterized protein n=1 Tax=Puccinia sorghi TaxID=27349 RepID=A0A0L6VRQ3_9BASI|nr:hypothetical protein VP01_1152g3 [Puccinia sorghi]
MVEGSPGGKPWHRTFGVELQDSKPGWRISDGPTPGEGFETDPPRGRREEMISNTSSFTNSDNSRASCVDNSQHRSRSDKHDWKHSQLRFAGGRPDGLLHVQLCASTWAFNPAHHFCRIRPTGVHYAIDAVLVSVCLSGIRRSTGLSPAVSKIQNKEIRRFLVSYLEVGEWIMDFVIVFMGRSDNFERR